MGRPQPIDVHPNSKGKKHLKFQELLHAEEGYAFIPIDGKQKTDLYNKGLLDGRKREIPFFSALTYCESPWSIVVPLPLIVGKTVNNTFVGVLSLDQTYLVKLSEANAFNENVCMTCESFGTEKCFMMADFDCGVDDREQYRDTSWFEMQKEIRKHRKQKAFPA